MVMKKTILSALLMAVMLLNTSCCWSQEKDPQAEKKEIISNMYTRVCDDFMEMYKSVKSDELRDFWLEQAACVRHRKRCNPDDVVSLLDYLRINHYRYYLNGFLNSEEYQVYKNKYLK